MDIEDVTMGCMALIVIGVLVLIVGGLIASIFPIHYETGRGSHTGYVTAVEKEGVIFKTGRAYIKSELSSSQEDAYCVTDEDVYQKLAEASQKKEQVTVKHVSWLSAGINYCKSESAVIVGL